MSNDGGRKLPWQLFLSELAGTAALLLGGMSLVIVMFGEGSPIPRLVPDLTVRRTITGFLFGSIGGSIALSPVGNVSGAHINPAVTFGFLIAGKLKWRVALGYVIAQLAGAVLGCVPLLAWGKMGRSVAFGATIPGPGYSTATVLLGEAITTFGLVAVLSVFLAFRRLRRFTPAAMPVLYALMVPAEAGISGTSTNPARTLGPAVVSGAWEGWWIYWLGPVIGTAAAILAFRFLAVRIKVAKLYHFDSDQGGVFRAMSRPANVRRST